MSQTKKQLLEEIEVLKAKLAQYEAHPEVDTRPDLQHESDNSKFQALFNNCLDAILIADDTGAYVEVNPAACKLINTTREQLLGKNIYDLSRPQFRGNTTRLWQQFLEQGESQGEFELYCPDGQIVQTEFKAKAHFLPGIHLSILRDITARKQAEKALRNSENLYRILAQKIPNGAVFLFDHEMRFILAEGSDLPLHGFSKETVEGKRLKEVASLNNYEELAPHYQKILEGQIDNWELENRGLIYQVNGVPLRDEQGEVYAGLALSYNITRLRQVEEELQKLNLELEKRVDERTIELERALLQKDEALEREKTANQALQENERFIQSITNTIPDVIYIFDIIELRTSYINDFGKKILDYSLAELEEMGNQFLELTTHPEDYPLILAHFERLKTSQPGEILELEYRMKPKKGEWRWFLSRDQLFAFTPDHLPIQILGVAQDITERKHLFEALEQSYARYRHLIETAAEGVWIVDAQNATTFVNERMAEILGYTQEEMLGLPLSAFVKGADPGQIARYMERRRQGLKEQVEYPMPRKDGSHIWVLTSNNPIFDLQGNYQGALSMFSDITKLKETEKRLREREKQYRSIFEATTDAMFIVDLATGNINEVNPAGCELYGYSREELLEKPAVNLIRSDYQPSFWNNLGTTRAGQPFKTIAIDVRKDGTEFMAEVFAVDFLYQGHSNMLAVVRDVTEREQAYQLLEQKVTQRTRELSTLLEFSKEAVSAQELKPLLDFTLDQIGILVEFAGITVLVRQSVVEEAEEETQLQEETASFKLVAYRGPLPQETVLEQTQLVLGLDSVKKAVLKIQQSPSPPTISDVTRPFEDLIDEQLDSQTRQAISSYFANLPYARAWMIIPMIVKEQVVGLISLTHNQPGYYTPTHARTLSILANHLGTALENLRLNKQAKALAILEERQRLARDLHDSVVQILYSIGLSTNTALARLEAQPDTDPLLLKTVEDTLSLTEAGLDEMRALIFELRPESLAVEGLLSALQKQATALHSRHKMEIELDLPGEEPALTLQIKDNLYRIAQEAFHNVVKHARAKRVALRLYRDSEGSIILEVRDDGRGFDPTGPFPGHLGLRSMEERASRIGGQFILESNPGQGTVVQVHLKLRKE